MVKRLSAAALVVALALGVAGCSADAPDDQSQEADLSQSNLRDEEARLRAEATVLAGRPQDIPQRVVFLHEMYEDSNGNHAFPEVALHGALWADRFFRAEQFFLDAGKLFNGIPGVRDKVRTVDEFGSAIKTTNRQVFIDTYTNYWFSKKHGDARGADRTIDPDVLPHLRRVHAATARGDRLGPRERREIFLAALNTEQKDTVATMMDAAAREIQPPWLKELMMRPVVKFTYFPRTQLYAFHDFSDRNDRVRCATKAYDLAEEAGWPKVTETMKDYRVLPATYFVDRQGYARALRERLLGTRE